MEDVTKINNNNQIDISKIILEFATDNNLDISEFKSEDFKAFWVSESDLRKILTFLRDNPDLRFCLLTDLFGADFPERLKRFEVVYSLLSLKLNKRILIKVKVSEEDTIPSIADLHNSACWYEREVFDMYGIIFEGAQDLRRILTDYSFKGHPLRKDFPVTGHVEMRYDEKLEKVIYEPVMLDQEFRNFDFCSPWQGPDRVILPGDEKATEFAHRKP